MKHNPALDGIRALAVAMVMCFHAMVPDTGGGYLGVDVFFVLSGFLITSLLLNEIDATGTINLPLFYLRRLSRLGPALILMLATYLVVAPIAWPHIPFRTDVRDVLVSLFYLSDYTNAFWNFPAILRHTWSLSVEEHFYLVWPLMLLALARLPSRRHRILAMAALYVVFSAWRVFCELNVAQGYQATYYRFDTRLSGLSLGALLAFVLSWRAVDANEKNIDAAALLASFVILMATWRFSLASNGAVTFGVTLIEWATLCFIYAAISIRKGIFYSLLASPVMQFIGRISYGIYLWHYPIFRYLWSHYPWYITISVGGSASVILATLSYYTVEKLARTYWQSKAAERKVTIAPALLEP